MLNKNLKCNATNSSNMQSHSEASAKKNELLLVFLPIGMCGGLWLPTFQLNQEKKCVVVEQMKFQHVFFSFLI